MKSELVDINSIKPNPNNPRVIKDYKFKLLVSSIQEFPKMFELRPIVVNKDMVVLGGNMRLRAAKDAGLAKVHICKASDLDEAEQKEFIIKDNVSFGEWDYDVLANEWDQDDLKEWGLDMPVWNENLGSSEQDEDNHAHTAETYLNNSIRQIVLYYDVETHSKVFNKLTSIGEDYNIEEDNSSVILKLIEFYEQHK